MTYRLSNKVGYVLVNNKAQPTFMFTIYSLFVYSLVVSRHESLTLPSPSEP